MRWVTNGGNLWNQRYSPLDAINADNVAELKGVWRVHLDSGMQTKHSGEAQPLYYNDTTYVVTGAAVAVRVRHRTRMIQRQRAGDVSLQAGTSSSFEAESHVSASAPGIG